VSPLLAVLAHVPVVDVVSPLAIPAFAYPFVLASVLCADYISSLALIALAVVAPIAYVFTISDIALVTTGAIAFAIPVASVVLVATGLVAAAAIVSL
jgi:hypothetical protein